MTQEELQCRKHVNALGLEPSRGREPRSFAEGDGNFGSQPTLPEPGGATAATEGLASEWLEVVDMVDDTAATEG